MKSCRSSHPRCATHRCSYVPPPPKQPQPIQRRLPYLLLLSLLLPLFKQLQQRPPMAAATVCNICTAIPALPIIFIRRCHVHRPFILLRILLHRPAAAALLFRRMAATKIHQLAIMQQFQITSHTAVELNPRSHQLLLPQVVVVAQHPLFPDRLIHSLDLCCSRLDAMSPFGSLPARRSNLMSRYDNIIIIIIKEVLFVVCDAGVVCFCEGPSTFSRY